MATAATLVLASPALADDCGKDKSDVNALCEDKDKDKDKGWPRPINGPSPASTPELGSLVLFGTGVAGAAGYMMLRLRARRRPD